MSPKNCHETFARGYFFAIVNLFIINVWLCADASAAPEEIQVYLDEFAETGKPGLDLHTNYVTSGQQATNHQFRLTPEYSYGINSNWELGAYWLAVKNPGGSPQTDGVKLRVKWRPQPPTADTAFYWAVNFEAGQLSRRYYPDVTSGEIKLIGVWKSEPWTLGLNLNFDRALRSHPIQTASTEIDTKIAYQFGAGWRVGIENYSALGANHYDPSQPQSSQANYLDADFSLGHWDFNVGIGRASGQTPDKTVLKAIVGVPF